MARAAAAGAEVQVVVVTRGQPTLVDEELVRRIRAETLQAHGTIVVADTCFLDFPAAGLDQVRRSELNAALSDALSRIAPDLLLFPFIGDIHLAHHIVFIAALVHAPSRGPGGPTCVLPY